MKSKQEIELVQNIAAVDLQAENEPFYKFIELITWKLKTTIGTMNEDYKDAECDCLLPHSSALRNSSGASYSNKISPLSTLKILYFSLSYMATALVIFPNLAFAIRYCQSAAGFIAPPPIVWARIFFISIEIFSPANTFSFSGFTSKEIGILS